MDKHTNSIDGNDDGKEILPEASAVLNAKKIDETIGGLQTDEKQRIEELVKIASQHPNPFVSEKGLEEFSAILSKDIDSKNPQKEFQEDRDFLIDINKTGRVLLAEKRDSDKEGLISLRGKISAYVEQKIPNIAEKYTTDEALKDSKFLLSKTDLPTLKRLVDEFESNKKKLIEKLSKIDQEISADVAPIALVSIPAAASIQAVTKKEPGILDKILVIPNKVWDFTKNSAQSTWSFGVKIFTPIAPYVQKVVDFIWSNNLEIVALGLGWAGGGPLLGALGVGAVKMYKKVSA